MRAFVLFTLSTVAAAAGVDASADVVTPATRPPVAGLWRGTSGSRSIRLLVREDGTFHLLYFRDNSMTLLGGFVQGVLTGTDGQFASSEAMDFNAGTGVVNASVSGTYEARRTLRGRVDASASGSWEFTATSDLASRPPLVLEAEYAGFGFTLAETSEVTRITFKTGNMLEGFTENGCLIRGLLTGRGAFFAATLAYSDEGTSPVKCGLVGQTASGVALIEEASNGHQRVTITALNARHTDGTILSLSH